jgi:hypothetical protein
VRNGRLPLSVAISLFLPEISLLPKIISLLIFAGNLPRSGCGTGVFRSEIASKSVEIAKFPVIFPVSRELQVETGSYLTAHTTTSLCKPPFPESTPNRALLRGFRATYFPGFRLCRRSRFFVMIFGGLSLRPEIPFLAAGPEREVRPRL